MARKSKEWREADDGKAPEGSTEQVVASSLMLADIAMRLGTSVLRKGVERTFLRGRYGKEAARELVQNRNLGRTAASMIVAKIGSKSLPGAALVGTGLVVKLLFDRSAARRDARKRARQDAISDQSEQ